MQTGRAVMRRTSNVCPDGGINLKVVPLEDNLGTNSTQPALIKDSNSYNY